MKVPSRLAFAVACALCAPVFAAETPAGSEEKKPAPAEEVDTKPRQVTTEGSVTVEGRKLDYKAVAGTILLTGKDRTRTIRPRACSMSPTSGATPTAPSA